ncbi:MAG: orotidine-5'-phosphate decarboxylase [Paludibacteraceae bacterium]|nr:orotidine-5'-phosphate decarboxylase [Paludibacteraceae bacterium]
MTREELFGNICRKRSFLCVGLDIDAQKIPEHLFDEADDALLRFNQAIIDATADLCVAYTPNLALYEAMGAAGMELLEQTIQYIRINYPDQFVIADAKRGDIGNTARMYAKAAFEGLDADAVTVAPYMGADSVMPFLEHEGRWTVLLALTSNKGAADFQMREDERGMRTFEHVLQTSRQWGTPDNLMYVVGATQAMMLADVRRIVPDNFLLVPGVGAQGGSLDDVARYGMNNHCGLLVNSSRGILYASDGQDYAEAARNEAMKLQKQMDQLLTEFCR